MNLIANKQEDNTGVQGVPCISNKVNEVTTPANAAMSSSQFVESGVAPLEKGAMLSRRYEMKYRIPEMMALAIREYIREYTQPDYYTACQPSGKYMICSMYMDSRELNLYHETFQDKCNRFKLRIRGYDDNPDSPVFFEIKRKLNRVIYKSRARVNKNEIRNVLNGEFPPGRSDKDLTVLQQYYYYSSMLQAQPVAMVRYLREAYENEGDSRVRITFDRHLCCRKVTVPEYTIGDTGWTELPINFVVLEIKFTENFPIWIHHLVQLFNLNRQSMSKYCTTVKHLTRTGYYNPLCPN